MTFEDQVNDLFRPVLDAIQDRDDLTAMVYAIRLLARGLDRAAPTPASR
jgi:hypothetical protein